jgi:hypothetical protein
MRRITIRATTSRTIGIALFAPIGTTLDFFYSEPYLLASFPQPLRLDRPRHHTSPHRRGAGAPHRDAAPESRRSSAPEHRIGPPPSSSRRRYTVSAPRLRQAAGDECEERASVPSTGTPPPTSTARTSPPPLSSRRRNVQSAPPSHR